MRGGLVGAEASGEVVISPLAEPNFGEGQVDLRVTGLVLKQMVEGQMAALSEDDSDEARSTLDLLSQLVGLSMLMDSLGIPAEDEDALDFVLEVPLGAPSTSTAIRWVETDRRRAVSRGWPLRGRP